MKLPTRHKCKQALRFWERGSLRPIIQWAFLILILTIGVQFAAFVWQLERGIESTISRPPAVEAFLPISALISLRFWLLTGVFNQIHPSGLVLLLLICSTALILKRGFCSWICPFGLLGDYLEKAHRFVFRTRVSLPRWLDYPLRSLKYLLLLFFLWAIFVQMDVVQLARFIDSPYNRIADIKMLKFFVFPSRTTMVVLAILTTSSWIVPFSWCRYLCPYGALLGALSLLSPFKIRRNRETCISCGKCSQVCSARIAVHTVGTVLSDECHACLRCVDSCPVDRTLHLSTWGTKVSLRKPAYAAAIILVFVIGTSAARVSGYWRNAISPEEYRIHIMNLHHPSYGHSRGEVPVYDLLELGIDNPARVTDSASTGDRRRCSEN